MTNRRVVVTGIGIVSSLGMGAEETWKRVCEGESGADYIRAFDAEDWPTQVACEVKNFQLQDEARQGIKDELICRPVGFGLQAAFEAIAESGIEGKITPFRFGVSVGASAGAVSPELLVHSLNDQDEAGSVSPEVYPMIRNHPGMLASLLSTRYKARGLVTTHHTACSSSGQSLGNAYLQIKRGDCDAMLAGGADSLSSELLLSGFCLLGTLSTRNTSPKAASRPFDRGRDGFVPGEGAAFFILEEYEHAKKRGAKIYCEFSGYGETESAYRITDLPPDGRGIREAMQHAIEQGGVCENDVTYINAHGTATQLNDRIESLAIRNVFGSKGAHPFISSTKSETGHMIAAAGAIEAAFCALSIRDGIIPPTANLEDCDCGDDLAFVIKKVESNVSSTLSNSIGFGGTNTSILFREVPLSD